MNTYDRGHKVVQYISGVLLKISLVQNSFLKKIIAILVFASLFSHSLCRIGITAWYELNRNSITRLHCVNKDKPKLKCNGKCYLKKQLNKLKQNNEAPARSGDTKVGAEEYPVFVVPGYIVCNFRSTAGMVVFFGEAHSVYKFLHERLVFHPPQPAQVSACV